MPLSHATSSAPDDWCATSWQRLYSLACVRGCDPHTAEDTVQEVFVTLARLGRLETLAQQPAEARQGLLARCLKNRVARDFRDSHRLKRGGGHTFVSLDDPESSALEVADERCSPPPQSDDLGALRQALTVLQSEMRPELWSLLSGALLEGAKTRGFNVAQRVALHRARRRLKQLMMKMGRL